MNRIQKGNLGQRVLLGLAGLGIWLPITGFGLLFVVFDRSNPSLSQAMGFAGSLPFLAQMEIGAIILLVVYALWAKPWRLADSVRDTFQIHASAAGIVVVSASVFVLTLG